MNVSADDGIIDVEVVDVLDVGDMLGMWSAGERTHQLQLMVSVRVAASETAAPSLLVHDTFDVRAVVAWGEEPLISCSVALVLPIPPCALILPLLADVDPHGHIIRRLAREGVPGWDVGFDDQLDDSTPAT
jgi:hypothetical protein